MIKKHITTRIREFIIGSNGETISREQYLQDRARGIQRNFSQQNKLDSQDGQTQTGETETITDEQL